MVILQHIVVLNIAQLIIIDEIQDIAFSNYINAHPNFQILWLAIVSLNVPKDIGDLKIIQLVFKFVLMVYMGIKVLLKGLAMHPLMFQVIQAFLDQHPCFLVIQFPSNIFQFVPNHLIFILETEIEKHVWKFVWLMEELHIMEIHKLANVNLFVLIQHFIQLILKTVYAF